VSEGGLARPVMVDNAGAEEFGWLKIDVGGCCGGSGGIGRWEVAVGVVAGDSNPTRRGEGIVPSNASGGSEGGPPIGDV